MHKTTIAILGACVLLSSQAYAAQPSFNCRKATHEVEQMICRDAELAELDHSLAELYALVLEDATAAQKKRLKAEQNGWIKGRNDCWKASDQRGCIKAEYEMRIRELKDR